MASWRERPSWKDFVHAAALLVAFVRLTFENNAVTAPDRARKLHFDASCTYGRHTSQVHASVGRALPDDEGPVLTAIEPTVAETARKRQSQLLDLRRRILDRLCRLCRVDRLAGSVVLCHVGHVLSRFQSPLDLHRRHTGLDQPWHQFVCSQVLRADQVTDAAKVHALSVTDQLVRHATRLGTLAPVGAAAAERQARQALSGIAHAECSVNEHLQFDRGLAADLGDLGNRQLAGEHHSADSKCFRHPDALATGQRHLRRGVNGQFRANRLRQSSHAEVLHQQGVDTGRYGQTDHPLDLFQLVGECQGVDRQIASHAPAAQECHQFFEPLGRDVRGPGPGVEPCLQAEVDRVGAVFHGCLGAIEIAGGSEQLDGM